MICEKPDCDNDETEQYETSGPPEGQFRVALCEKHAPTFATASD